MAAPVLPANAEPRTVNRELPAHVMDPDLARLCAIPGHYDLSAAEVAEVIQVDARTVRRMVQRGRLEAKLHQGRGDGKETRMRFTRLSVVLYLVRVSSGDRAAILGSISLQCPEYLKLAQALCTSLGGRCLVDLDGDDEDASSAADETPRRRPKVKAKRAAPKKTRALKVLKQRPETRKRRQRRTDAAKTARRRKTKRVPARKKTRRA